MPAPHQIERLPVLDLRLITRASCRLACLSCVFALLLVYTPLVQAGPDNEFEYSSGHWVGRSEWSSAHVFESCMIAEHNDDNELLVIRHERSGGVIVAVFEKKWMAATMKKLPILAFADHDLLFSGIGLLYAPDVLAFEAREPEATKRILRAAKLLSVTANGLSSVFALSGSDAAIDFLEDCVGKGLLAGHPVTWLIN